MPNEKNADIHVFNTYNIMKSAEDNVFAIKKIENRRYAHFYVICTPVIFLTVGGDTSYMQTNLVMMD